MVYLEVKKLFNGSLIKEEFNNNTKHSLVLSYMNFHVWVK